MKMQFPGHKPYCGMDLWVCLRSKIQAKNLVAETVAKAPLFQSLAGRQLKQSIEADFPRMHLRVPVEAFTGIS